MDDNRLTSLPSDGFNKLTNLRHFHVYHNQLRDVPFPLSYTPSESCKAQGIFEFADTIFEETNCFTTCPSACCTSDRRWPNCASTSSGATFRMPTTSSSTPSIEILIGAIAGGVVLLVFGAIIVALWVRRRKKNKTDDDHRRRQEVPSNSSSRRSSADAATTAAASDEYVPMPPVNQLDTKHSNSPHSSKKQEKSGATEMNEYSHTVPSPELWDVDKFESAQDRQSSNGDSFRSVVDENSNFGSRSKYDSSGAFDSSAGRTSFAQSTTSSRLERKNTTNGGGVWFIDVADLELSKKLGEGAFGVVCLGKWKKAKVAVKQIKLEAMGRGSKKVCCFRLLFF